MEALVISQLLVVDAELPNGEPPSENAPNTLIAGLLSPFAYRRPDRRYWKRVSLIARGLIIAVSVTCKVCSVCRSL